MLWGGESSEGGPPVSFPVVARFRPAMGQGLRCSVRWEITPETMAIYRQVRWAFLPTSIMAGMAQG